MSLATRESIVSPLSNFTERLGSTLVRRPFYHGLGWLAFFGILVILQLQAGEYSIGLVLVNELITIVVFMVVVYTNLLFLFPNYLKPGRFWIYLAALIGLSVIFTPMELVIKYFLFSYREQVQVDLLNNMEAYFLGNFLIGGVSSMGKIMTDWIAENRKKQEVENETMQSELRFLKSQINPHFLFNTLNSLYALTLKKSDKAPDIVIKLSEMMRYMLYECNEPQVPLRKEINYLRNYLDLERLRQREGIDITLEVKGQVVDQQIAPLLLIPFLENSFKHGINAAIRGGFVHAVLQVEQKSIHFELENTKGNVLPRSPDAARPSGGIGLVNVRRRLELLYPNRHQLEITETPSTYAVHLNLIL
ncbi:sensor histidine kinase YesM [Lewinella aquimaris]|uniref:Sensor histidine kinase YesM n=1 Tax=Neolewinella aquimaris TaxID=1835722 RepID=A0A840E922_9BACT|nr:histidine kinase [Neolewinella aquimaris]MBB4079827.1 sensor histidine kinase YesM [Neolewinella aquimaris]